MLEQLGHAKREQLLDACANVRCQVLLGAGASAGSLGGDRRPLPGGLELARQLEGEFALAPSDRDLREVTSRLVRRGEGDRLYDYLHRRFTNCTPADWYEDFVALHWARVWTLNIDDVVETAYKKYSDRRAQNLESHSFDDPYAESRRDVQLVHLHGHVSETDRRNLIFALIEYVDAIAAGTTWHSVFGDLWLQSPFVIVGASLREEFDLARFFESRTRLDSQLAVYVARSIDPDWREDLELWGLTVIEGEADAFFRELYSEVRPRQVQRMSLQGKGRRRSASLVHFGQHFSEVSPEAEAPGRHDLLAGDYPRFNDIFAEADVPFDFCRAQTAAVEERLRDGSSAMMMTIGPALSGKTVALMRTAVTLKHAGRSVYWFRGESRPDPVLVSEAIHELAGPVVLVVDDIAPWGVAFARLMGLLDSASDPLVVLGSSRERRLPFLVSIVPATIWDKKDTFRSVPLSLEDAERLDRHLDKAGRLNRMQSLSPNERRRIFRIDGVFDGLYRAAHGPRFRERIQKLYDESLPPEAGRLAYVAALLDQRNLAVPMSVVWQVLGDLQKLEGEEGYGELFDVGADALRLRYRSVASDHLLAAVPAEEGAELLVLVLRALSRLVNEDTIRSGSTEAEIMKALLRARALRAALGLELARSVMEELEGTYGWDGGYWEQRSIVERLSAEYRDAERFAIKAASMLDDDHRNTTLGATLLDRASNDSSLGTLEAVETCRRGIDALDRARLKRPTNPVPILRCLAGISEFLGRRGSRLEAADVILLQSKWSQWYQHGARLEGFAYGDLATELEGARSEWERVIGALLS